MTLAIATVIPGVAGATTDRNVHEEFVKTLAKNEESLIEFRRHLHRFPEIAGEEQNTAAAIVARMKAAGLEVRTGVGGYGVVAVLKGERPGPVVAYRADMDAIASTGPDPVPFASEDPALRHGCGHDIHVAVAVGIAETMAAFRDEMQGTVVFYFQPAEETAEGAAAMIADGAMKDPAPEAVFAVHCAPLEVGTIGSRSGMLLAGLDVAQVTLSGDGNIDEAANKVAAIFTGINTVDPSGGVQIEGDTPFTAAGVFDMKPADGGGKILTGMVRASSEENHKAAEAAVKEGVGAIDVADVDHEVEYNLYAIPPVMNDPALVEQTNRVITIVQGPDALSPIEGVTPFFSEDFSHFQNEVPGVLYFLGVSNTEKGTMGLPHHPAFVPDEGAIVFGASTMASVLWDYLEQH
jgi:metal-dependent amidase/aminoacylase/carboxypeptidase family protein